MRALYCIPLLLSFAAYPFAGWCDEIAIELGELDAALEEAGMGGNPLDRLLANKIQAALSEAGLQLDQGRLLYRDRVEDQWLDVGCSDTNLREMDMDIFLNAGTTFSLTLDSIANPIVLASDIDASLGAAGTVRQRFGVAVLGSCSVYAQDTFTFDVSGPVRLALSVTVLLNPEFAPGGIRITPQFEVTGELLSYNFAVNVDDTIVAGLIEDYIREEIEQRMRGDELAVALQGVEDDLHQAIIDSWGANNRTYTVPEVDDLQVNRLLDIVTQRSSFPIALEYVAENRLQILLALLTDDDDMLKQIVASSAACEASTILLADNPSEPLYTLEGDACVSADLTERSARDYFVDAQCTSGIAFRPTTYADFCAEALAPERLGNAAIFEGEFEHWTLNPGTRFDISIVPVTDNRQPFMSRTRYKSVNDCQLEMRVYKRSPDATGLLPLLAFHGGSWKYRGAAFHGFEAQVSHFTERGFAVFVPFYRLVGTEDGNSECNGVLGEDVISDVADALDWVLNHGADYGAANETVTVMGQSAGAHLAGWLAVHRAPDVERALLLYPPTDMGDILVQVGNGSYANAAGIDSVEGFLGMPLDAVDPASLEVADNSFPALVAIDPAAIPQAFILHGYADSLVPSRQAVRLCNAFSGSPDSGPARDDGGDLASGEYRNVFACDDRGSYLHLLAEAGHGLDVCVDGILCPAGGVDGQTIAADSLSTALEWLVTAQPADTTDVPAPSTQNTGTGSSGSGLGLMVIVLLLYSGAAKRAMRKNTGRIPQFAVFDWLSVIRTAFCATDVPVSD